ncbi:hypothetical protein CP533_1391 [Ophiocordyceps camponoti-saundersi (nom. inval.)]|nr:hypothetical protein CP533_1391 [Ophiocordyceps camponoti-saundersi (nom. inval.)]
MPVHGISWAAQAIDARHRARHRASDRSLQRLPAFEQRNTIHRLAAATGQPSTPTRNLNDNSATLSPYYHPRRTTPPRWEHPLPYTRLIADTRFPWLWPNNPALAEIREVYVPPLRRCGVGGNQLSRSTTAGVGSRKRPAETTEIDLVAELHSLPGSTSEAETPPCMSGGTVFGRITAMMSNIYSTVTAFGGKLMRAIPVAYNVLEQRQYVAVPDSDEPHVANKRFKLTSVEDVCAYWLQDEDSVRKLVQDKDDLLDRLRLICNIISKTCGDNDDLRANMNRRLRPLQFVFGRMTGLTLVFTDVDDLCDAWFRNVDNCITVSNVIYNIGFFFTHKNKHALVPESLEYGLNDLDRQRLKMAVLFFSAPALPSFCDEILELSPDRPETQFPTALTDQMAVDLQAIDESKPVPSFIVPGIFRDNICKTFPPEPRIELDRQFRFPGFYPEEESESFVREETGQDVPELTTDTIASTPVPDTPPVVTEADTSRFRKWCANYMEWRIQSMTPQLFRAHFYRESDAHSAIQDQYITEVEPRTPVAHARRPRSILANRATRRTPPRLAATRAPRTVRFTENTISPRPRTHLGLDVPRLIEADEERRNPDVPFTTVGRAPLRLSAQNNLVRMPRFRPNFSIPSYFYDRTQGETDEPWKPLWSAPDPPSEAWKERDALRKAQAPARLQELVNLPACEGLTDVPLSELLDRLIKKGLVDTSYRDAYRAKLKKAEEEARQKAEEEEAKRRAEEEAKRAEEEAQRLAEEEARRFAEEEARRAAEEEARRAAEEEARRAAEEEARRAAEEEARRAAEEEARRAAEEEARRVAAEAAQREYEERLTREGLIGTRGLRLPRRPLVSLPSQQWVNAAQGTLTATASRTLAKTSEGSDLRRHDFATVVPPTQWLNDEIINGTLLWMDKAINEAAGIDDVRRQTRKCLTLNSFFFKDLLTKGPRGTERKLRRCGVTRNNFLSVETILLPICDRAHWTMLVVRPGQKTVMHLDSLNPRGSSTFTTLAMSWLKEFLQEKFDGAEWSVVQEETPVQTNGHDCGVFALTNAMCMALGLSPIHTYAAADMPLQRIRIACMLLNGGFTGEFDLGVY